MKKIGIIGSGMVAQALAKGFIKYGYEAMFGTRDTSKLADWKGKAKTGRFEETAKWGEIINLAVEGVGAENAVKLAGLENLAGKTIINKTNPIADSPPQNGVLKFFTTLDNSLMERLQTLAPKANFVKCFSCVGNSAMVDPDFPGGKPTMFICGNNENAKKDVKEILEKFGWEIEDMGKAEAARAIEPLAILWCIPGFLQNRWTHALKMLTK